MSQAQSLDANAQFQKMHFMKCFELWHDHWAVIINSLTEYFEYNNIQNKEIILSMGEINLVPDVFYSTTCKFTNLLLQVVQ